MGCTHEVFYDPVFGSAFGYLFFRLTDAPGLPPLPSSLPTDFEKFVSCPSFSKSKQPRDTPTFCVDSLHDCYGPCLNVFEGLDKAKLYVNKKDESSPNDVIVRKVAISPDVSKSVVDNGPGTDD